MPAMPRPAAAALLLLPLPLLCRAAAPAPPRPEIAGEVAFPRDPRYKLWRLMNNGLCQQQPALIARPAGTADVSALVRFAVEHGLPLSVRNGGHSYTCQSIKDGGVHIDMRSMRGVELQRTGASPTGVAARIEGGAVWSDVLAAVPKDTYAIVHGDCPSVGAVGYTLQGGIGSVTARRGLAAEQVLGATVVLANGTAVTLAPPPEGAEPPELLWALRGGGSSLGVVTELIYKVYPVPEDSPAGAGPAAQVLAWIDDAAALGRVLDAQQRAAPEWTVEFWLPMVTGAGTPKSPVDTLGTAVLDAFKAVRALYGRPHVPAVLGVHYIGANASKGAEGKAALERDAVAYLASYGVETVPFPVAAQALQAAARIRDVRRGTATAAQLRDLPMGFMGLFGIEQAIMYMDEEHGVPAAQEVLFGPGSALNISAADDGVGQFGAECFFCQFELHSPMGDAPTAPGTSLNLAFRRSRVGIDVECLYDTSRGPSCAAATARLQLLLNRLARGADAAAYVNMPTCFLDDWRHKFWGDNYERLAAVKAAVDPAGLFSFCQSVDSPADTRCCPNANLTLD